jgi:hypothetical protein
MTCFSGGPYGVTAHCHTTLLLPTVCASEQDFLCGDEGRYQSEHGAPEANML